MTMEELAREIAEKRGRNAVTAAGCWLALERDLERHDLPCADADIQRLEDMITNLLDEAWGAWDEHQALFAPIETKDIPHT